MQIILFNFSKHSIMTRVLLQEALNEAAMSSSSNKKGQSSLAVAVADCRVLVKTLGMYGWKSFILRIMLKKLL